MANKSIKKIGAYFRPLVHDNVHDLLQFFFLKEKEKQYFVDMKFPEMTKPNNWILWQVLQFEKLPPYRCILLLRDIECFKNLWGEFMKTGLATLLDKYMISKI